MLIVFKQGSGKKRFASSCNVRRFRFYRKFFFLLGIFFLTVRGLGLIDQGRAHRACLQLFPARLTFITSLRKSTTFLLLGWVVNDNPPVILEEATCVTIKYNYS